MNAIFALLCVHELSSIETLPIAPWKLRFTVWPAALGDAKLSADGDTITPFGVVVGFTTTGTSSEFAPSTTENVHEPTAVGDTVNCCGEAPPPPVTVAIPLHEVASAVSVPLDAVAVNICDAPPTVNTIGFAVVVNVPPEAPPTLMPSVAERFPMVNTNVHTPLPVGVTVYVAGSVVDDVVIVATGPQPNGSIVGSGALAVVEVTVNVWAPAPGPLNPRLLGVTATEFAPGTGPLVGVGPGTMTVDEPPLLPPPQPARNTTAPTTAKNGRKRESA